jgi:IclR family transcriptional regulator, pca regulon regulatory protein
MSAIPKRIAAAKKSSNAETSDVLLVKSVEKAFRVLSAFDGANPALSLTQIATEIELDKSATQRFTHTLVKLGYLRKDPQSKRFELTPKTLDLAYHYIKANALVTRANPYLQHLSKTSEETASLTVLDETDIVFLSRFLSPHMLSTDVVVGTRMPAFCTAPGIAMLAHLPVDEARAILTASDLRAYTPHTTCKLDKLLAKISLTAKRGFSTAAEEYYLGDFSIAAPVLGKDGRPVGAVSLGVSLSRYSAEEAIERFSAILVGTAQSISRA